MNSKLVVTGVTFSLLLSTLPVHADPLDVKLGLWEITGTTQVSGMPMPESVLQSMPPEQRARMEAMFKKRQAQPSKSMTDKTCLTQEELNRPFSKQDDEMDKKCTQTVIVATRTVQEYKIQCVGSESRSGTMRLEALSRERIKSTMKMNTGRGAVNNEMNGHWIAADCGKVH